MFRLFEFPLHTWLPDGRVQEHDLQSRLQRLGHGVALMAILDINRWPGPRFEKVCTILDRREGVLTCHTRGVAQN
jgi:hypothetical protein